jgi:gliding motility-associated-like protein
MIITVNTTPNTSFNYASSTYCITGADPTPAITGTAGGTFTSTPAGLVINPTTGIIDLSASALNTYTITYSITGACAGSSTFTVTVTDAPSTIFSYAGPYCQSGTNPLPTFNPGSSAGTFSASPAGLIFVSTSTGEIDMASSVAGTYTVTNTIAAAGGCAASTSNFNVIIIASTTVANAGPDQSICGSTATLSANTAVSGTGIWTVIAGGGVFADPSSPNTTVSGLIGTNVFQWEIIGTAPCQSTWSHVTITSVAGPIMTSQNSATICSGGSVNISLTSDNPSNYSWVATDNPNTTGESLVPQFTSTLLNTITNNSNVPQLVTYTVTPTLSASGCVGIAQTVTVTVNPAPTITSAANATICSGNSPNITFTSDIPANISWVANDNPNTTGESLSSQTSVSLDDVISSSSVNQETVNYIVSLNSIAGNCAGNSQNVAVLVNPVPVIPSAAGTSICSGGTINIALSSNIPSTFDWIAADNPNVTGESLVIQTSSTISNTLSNASASPQSVNYTATPISVSGNCAGTAQAFTVTVNPLDNASFNYPLSTYCQTGGNPVPSITGIPGGVFTSSPAGLSIDPSSGLINLSSSLLNTYTVTYTTNGACPNSNVLNLSVTTAPNADFSFSGPYCQTGANPLPEFSAGASAGTFSATPAGLSFINTATGEIDLANSVPGTYTITNNITASGGCAQATATYTVVINPPTTVANAGTDQSVCGNSAILNGNTPTTGSGTWTVISGSGTISDIHAPNSSITNLGSGSTVLKWTITGTAPCILSTTSAVTITTVPKPTISGASSATICSDAAINITLTADIPSTFTWVAENNPNVTGESLNPQNSSVINNTLSNRSHAPQIVVYNVSANSLAGNCAGDPQLISVIVKPAIHVFAGNDTIAVANEPHQLHASGGVTYLWNHPELLNSPVTSDPLAVLNQDTKFIVEATNELGCKGRDTIFIKVYDGPTYYVPTAFSPNGDGLNDIFRPIPVGIVYTEWFRVYNRWGQLIFESSEWMKGWNGKYRGEAQPLGTYVWAIKGKNNRGKDIFMKGAVVLVR